MQTYVRMLKMIKPYLGQALASVFFMVLFSFFSIFSITMISPFLDALFLHDEVAESDDLGITRSAADALVVQDESSLQAVEQQPAEQKPADVRSTLSLVDRWKYDFKDKVGGYMLRGTRQQALLRICLVFFFMVLGKNVTGYFQEILMVYVSHSVIRDLRDKLFLQLTSLPLSFYHHHKAGELISRATNDVLVAEKCVNVSFTKLVRDPMFIVSYLAVALILSWKLTLLAVVLLPVSLLVIIRIGKKLRKYSYRQQEQMANLTIVLQETVYGIRVIKAFAMEGFENRKFIRVNQKLFQQVFKIDWVMKLSAPLTEQLSILVGLTLLWYGGSKVFTGGAMAPDLFIVFLFCIFSLVRPIKSMGQLNASIQEGMAAAERIFTVLDTPAELADPPLGERLPEVVGEVEMRQVGFSYVPGEPVLQDIDLKVRPGEVVALVGSSGAGKSTLVDLIAGFYFAQQGQVLIDGHDIRGLNLIDLRQHLGVVTQEVILFNDTIHNNIVYGAEGASEEEVVAAAQAANADEFIRELPAGYQTRIGDRGINISGGQRQRLSIARAILRNPPLLLLDEATSALDSESELLVQEAIDQLVRNRTTFVIAHRLSTVQNVDRIYVMDEGRIVQEGTHTDLLAQEGRYRGLYQLQFQKQARAESGHGQAVSSPSQPRE
jgi:subfamily B ATP-binding cassette protein MsbA